MTQIDDAICRGTLGVEGAAGLRNPVVKLLTLIVPMGVVVYQQLSRTQDVQRLGLSELVVVGMLLYAAATVNLSERDRPKWLMQMGVWGIATLVLYIVVKNPESLLGKIMRGLFSRMLGEFAKVISSIPVVSGIAPESWVLLIFFAIMFVAIRNFTTRDALWIGRRILWRWAFTLYAITITTFAVINSALPLRMRLSQEIAGDKTHLLKNRYIQRRGNVLTRVQKQIWIFASTLITHNAEMALAIEALVSQRGTLRYDYYDRIGIIMGEEDIVAVVLVLLCAFVVITMRM